MSDHSFFMTLHLTPYTPPPYADMIAHRRMPDGITEAGYNAGIKRLLAVEGVVLSDMTYEVDALRITGAQVVPQWEAGERGPLLVYNRGGSGEYGALSPAQLALYMVPYAQRLRAGVLASNYRGNFGSEGAEEFGGADVRDVLALVELGKQQPWWDGKNIFMLGWSRGGMMTYLAMKHGLVLQAAVVGAGLSDLTSIAAQHADMVELYERRIPGFAERREAELVARSAIRWPEHITAPLLMLHGDADPRIDVADARALYESVADRGAEVRYIEFPGGDHYLLHERQQVQDAAVEWFAAHRVEG